MKTFITLIILCFTTIALGQKTIDLNFWIRSNGTAMSNAEIKFYSTEADTIIHTATADGQGYIFWKNAPVTDLKMVYYDTTYTYCPKTHYLYKKGLTKALEEVNINKLSDHNYKSLMAAMEKSNSDSIREVIDQGGTVAEYTGGREAMVEFLQRNMRVPSSAEEEGIDGKVYLRFVIEADGTLKNLAVKKSLTPDTDFEAMRVISMMPKWKPATYKGVAIPMYYTLPIAYRVM
jgi:TonB family protein